MPACPACGSHQVDGARFCSGCGAAFDDFSSQRTRTSLRPAGAAPPAPDAGGSLLPAEGRFLPGTLLSGRYRVIGLLGKGGMGEVYRADDLKLGRPVALKFLPRELEADPARLQRFLNEARVALAVTHPNVCRVYDIGELSPAAEPGEDRAAGGRSAGRHFISMEYIDGEDLATLLRRIGRLPGDKALEIARQLCAGLAAAHEEGILHRDLKPANVMLDGRGRAKITDFGLAGLADGIAGAEILAGTPGYMAPEQLAGQEVSVRSDVYALGLVLYELFTGKPAFRAETLAELRTLQTEATPSSLSDHVAALDPTVEQVVLRCLEKQPERRPGSALAVAAALPGGDPLAAALAAGETPSPEMVAEAGKGAALRPAVAVGLALAGLALFVGVVRWSATLSTIHYLPLEKRPAVLVDRAQTILKEVGYVEPAYGEPVDRAWGFFTWNSVHREVAAADDSSRRWEGLRDRPDVGSLWYRQSTVRLWPNPVSGGPVITRGLVRLDNPFTLQPGEATVMLDLAGNLRRLQVAPKRFSTREAPEPDWMPLFAAAGLDPARFEEVRPRYQRFQAPDRRRAWVGTKPALPDVEYRVEAGSFEGRPTLFNVDTTASYEGLAADPQPSRESAFDSLLRSLAPLLPFALTILAIPIARRHLKQGRADRRGAFRWAVVVFGLVAATTALGSHVLFSRAGPLVLWEVLVPSVFFGTISWLLYVAAEPFGRRVWPTMFVSWSRLFSRPEVEWRDPILGRSVLVGLFFGTLVFLVRLPLRWWITTWREGAPSWLFTYDLDLLLGQRIALAELLDAILSANRWFLFVVTLVVLRHLLEHPWLAAAAAVLVWPLIDGAPFGTDLIYFVATAAISMAVLLRWGVVALMATQLVFSVAWIARSSDASAWHAQSAILAIGFVVALAAYGAWAATGRQRGAAAPA